MTLIRPSLDYTAKDFDAIRARLVNIIPSAFPEWTDQQVANAGNLLVELFSFVGDVLTFYQDNQAQESRWSTAILRQSILSMVKLIRYTPTGASAASAQLLVQLSAPPAGAVTIEAGDQFSTADVSTPLTFQALSAVTIAAAANPPAVFVTVEHSQATEDLFTSTDLADQRYVLAGSPYLDGSLVLTADNGEYELVDDFLGSVATDRHAVLTVDENTRATVTFGNGIAGASPTGTITAAYKVGGGSIGNVAQNSIRRVVKTYMDATGVPVSMTVTNPSKAGGGDDVQTVESIRERAPVSLRATSRTVCREDYEINARRVAGVARALMLTRDELPSTPENQGVLYIVPKGGGFATEALLTQVYNMVTVEYPKTITFKLAVLSAVYLKIDVQVLVHFRPNAKPDQVAKQIRKRLADYFSMNTTAGSDNPTVDFGFYMDDAIAWSDVVNVVIDTPGVRKLDDGLGNLTLNGEADDFSVGPYHFPVLGTVTIVNAATGTTL